jgi:predicted negative regulator of RcsB-dependent stress response
MATLDQDDANVFDAETINWRLIVYPVLVALLVVAGGLGYYYYQLNQRDQAESTARAALVLAKTPEDMVKVADQPPHTDQATLALLAAADASFTKRDFPAAIQDYQRIIDATGTDPELADSARIGLGSTFEATDKVDDAIHTYVEVGDRGDKSPYAAFAYDAAARLYQPRFRCALREDGSGKPEATRRRGSAADDFSRQQRPRPHHHRARAGEIAFSGPDILVRLRSHSPRTEKLFRLRHPERVEESVSSSRLSI